MDHNENLRLRGKSLVHCHNKCSLVSGFKKSCSILFGATNCSCKESWLKRYGLLTSEEVHPHFQELYLKFGYRPSPTSFSYSIQSVFYPTNETLNFWTHFISFIILFNRFHVMTQNLDGPVSDPIYLPFVAYAFGTCMMLLGSCIAHLFCSVSHVVRESCWFCDYGSITLSSLGSAMVYSNYICPFECIGISFPNSMLILGLLGIIGHAACCYSRMMTDKWRYFLRSSVFVVLYIGSSVPCGIKYFSVMFSSYLAAYDRSPSKDLRCELDSHPYENAVSFILVTTFCAITVFFNVSKLPEKWFPGRFDIVGHSHQWLHVSIAVAFYFQTFMIEDILARIEKLNHDGSLSSTDLQISYLNTIGVMGVTGILCLTTSGLFTAYNLTKKKTR